MGIVTKVGDGGNTYLIGGKRVPKNHDRVAVGGDLDELNALLGWAAGRADPSMGVLLAELQKEIFTLSAQIATPPGAAAPRSLRPRNATDIARLEKAIDGLEAILPPLTHFVLPGGSEAGAILHFARAVCRRAERALAGLLRHDKSLAAALIFLNRFSDYLFLLARRANQLAGAAETLWLPAKTDTL